MRSNHRRERKSAPSFRSTHPRPAVNILNKLRRFAPGTAGSAAFMLAMFGWIGSYSLFAQKPSIVPNGNTQTRVSTTGAITNVTTNTIRGNNAYNSFSTFNVNQGNTVNLFLPSGTDNLLNLVNSQSSIDGILNSIKNGTIGGNLFFANPYGFIVGKNGIVNAGSFLAVTPTSAFMNQFFTAPGVPTPNATANLLNGTVPITPDGLISVLGKINVARSITLVSGNVHNSGSITSGAVFSGMKPDFSDVVNVAGLQSGTSISVQNGDIEIQAAGDFENSGRISTRGANNLNAGSINVHAGDDIKLDPNSLISAQGQGHNSNGGKVTILADKNSELDANAIVTAAGGDVSGNGGSVDFSAKGTASLNGGVLKAGATHGTAGTVTIDPTDLNITQNDTPNDGSNLAFSGDTITVAPGVVISSRQIGSGTDLLNSPSTGNSGSITLTANSNSETPSITIGDGAQILAHATNGFTPGDVTLTASQTSGASQAVAAANINIGNALIQGGNINISATAQATGDSSTNGTLATTLNDTSLGFLINGLVAANTSKATSGVTIGNSASSGTAHINAAGTITIESDATSTTTSDLTGISGFAYGQSNSTATANVANTAALNAGGAVALNAKSTNTLSVKETTTQQAQGVVAVAYGNSSSNSTAEVDGTVTGSSVQIGATNTNSFSTGASATDYDATTGNGGGAGIALGFYESKANTVVTGAATATAADVQISSNSTNTDNITRSSSSVPSQGFKAKVAAAHAWTQNLGGALSQTTVTSALGLSPSVAPRANSTQLGLAGAVSVAETTNTATTTVSGNATSRQGNVNIGSQSMDNPQISAAGSVSGQTTDLGGAVAVSDFHNTANTYVNGNAAVTGANGVSITAEADALNPALQQADLIGSGFTAIDSASDLANDTDMKNLAENVKSGIEDLGVFTTSFVNTGLSTAGKGTSGFGIAGAVNLLGLTNQSIASVTGSATVTTNTGDLSVNATSNASAINVAGMGLSGSKLIKLNPGVKAGTSIGGSYNGTNLLNTSQAYIGDDTTATATQGGVNVNATTNTFAIDLAQAGDKATQFGIVGTFDDGSLTANSEAYIQSQANVNAGKDVNVTASNPLLAIGLGGALGTGGTAEVGVAVNWNQINDTTLAYIGDPSNTRSSTCTGCAVTAANNVNVTASSSEDVYGITFAATKSGTSGSGADGESSSTPTAETAPSAPTSGGSDVKGETGDNGAGGGGYGFGISGEIAFNEIDNGSGGPGVTTKAFINNGANVTATNGNINQTATDTSFAVAGGIAASVGQTAALAGAYSQNTIDKQIEASTSNATLSGMGLNLQAVSNGSLFAVTAGGGVNTESGVAIAGSINNNDITNTVTAELGNATQAANIGSNGVTINASEGSNGDRVLSVAGGFGLSVDGGGVGAAIDAGSYTNNVSSTVDSGANLNTTGNIQVTSSANVTYLPIAVSLAVGGDFGASGSLAADAITDTTTSTVGGTVSTTSNLVVGSNDSSSALIVAGGLGVGGDVGVGVTALIPQLNRTTESLIANNASVSAQGNGSPVTYDGQSVTGILLDAKTSGDLQDYSAAGAVSGSVSVAGAVILNPFFAGNPYTLKDDTEANVGADALVNGTGSGAAGQSVTLLATDTSGIQDAAGMLSLAGDLGLGVGFDAVSPSWTVNTSIGSGATINAAADVIASSNLQNSFTSYVVSGSGSAGVSGAGAVTVLNNTTNTNAYIDSGATVTANGNIVLAANRDTTLNVVDGGAAIGLYAGINGAVTDVSDDNMIQAYVGTNANVTALGQGAGISTQNGTINGLSIAATGTDDIQTFAAGGAAGLGAISGSILDNSFTENTTAKIDSNAAINGNNIGASSVQGVNLYASDITKRLTAGAGALAAGGIGIGVAVDAENVQKNTTAGIADGATVNANGALNVAAVSGENINSYTGAVGLGLGGLAGTSADYETNPIEPITKAYVSNVAVNAGSLGVNASENLTFTANTGELSDGGVALGAATALVNADANTSAAVSDSDVTLSPNGALSVISGYVGNVQGTALSGSGGVFSGNAAYATLADNSSTSASLSGSVPQAGAINVDATASRIVATTGGGFNLSGLGAGAVITSSSTSGLTTASVAGSIGQTTGENVQSLNISATDGSITSSGSSALNAGIGNGQFNEATATRSGTVQASIADSSAIQVAGNLTVDASAIDPSSLATTAGLGIGGLSVGESRSTASDSPTVKAAVGQNAIVGAGQNISIEAAYNYIANSDSPLPGNTVEADATSSVGALVGNAGGNSSASSTPTVQASFGSGSAVSAGNNMTVQSLSSNTISSDANGNEFTVTNFNTEGTTTSSSTISNNNTVVTGSGVTLAAGSNLTLTSQSTNDISNATAEGTQAGVLGLSNNTTTATASLTDVTTTTVGALNQVIGGANGTALIQALSNNQASSKSTDSAGNLVGGTNTATANTDVNTTNTTEVGGNAYLQAGMVTLDAEVTNEQYAATAVSNTVTLHSDATANSNVEVTSNVNANVDGGTSLTGANAITIKADQENLLGNSSATGKVVGVAGAPTAISDDNVHDNSNVNIAPLATLTTNNLSMEAISPSDKSASYKQTASAAGDTAVVYVTKTVEETVNEVFGWIPFVGDLVRSVTKWVTETVQETLDSDPTAQQTGSFNPSNTIAMNGTIVQPSGVNPVLVANNVGGNVVFTKDVNVNASVSGQTITINDLTNQAQPTISFNAPNGTVNGAFTVQRNTSWSNVTITNNTANNVVVNEINPVTSSSAANPDVSITAANNNATYNFVTDNAAITNVVIQNNSGSNVTLAGLINNPAGTITIDNAGGNIFTTANGLLKATDTSLIASTGNIGTSTNYVNLQMTAEDTNGANLSATAGQNIFLNAQLVQDVANTVPATLAGPGNINSIQSGGATNLNLLQPQAIVYAVSGTPPSLTVTPTIAAGVYNISNITGGSSVNVNQAAGPMNVGTVTSTNGNVSLTALSGDIDLGTVNSTNGTTNISASGSIVDVNHSGASDINTVSLNLTATNGLIGTSTDPLTIDSSYNGASGQVTASANLGVYLNQVAGDLNLGTVTSNTSDAALTSAGSIMDTNSTAVSAINANNVNLTAANGSIGGVAAAGNTLDIDATGQLTAAANQNANVTQITGPMNVNTVAATNGSVSLIAVSGDVDLGAVNSTKGNTTIVASGSISDSNNTSASSINAVNVNLTAQGGSIVGGAAAGNTLDIDATGRLIAAANQNANITQTTGPMNVNAVTATNGNVNLTASNSDVNLGTVNSAKGNTNVVASGSISDTNNTAVSAINANNVNITANNGSIGGMTVGTLEINATGQLTATANQNANITQTTGPMQVNAVTATNGNATLTAASGDVDLGTVNSSKGNTTIVASGSISDNNNTAANSINAMNVNLTAQSGSIGGGAGAGNTLDINATGQLTASANQNANIIQTAGPMKVNAITATNGNVNLATNAGDVDLGTVKALNGNITIGSSASILNTSGGNASLPNVTAKNTALTATNGSIGTSNSPLFVNNENPTTLTNGVPTGSNLLNTTSSGNTYITESQGNLLSSNISSSTGNIGLSVLNGNGNLSQITGNQAISLLINGSLLNIGTITGSVGTTAKAPSPNTVSLTVSKAGGTLTVNQMSAFQSVFTRADNTNLNQVIVSNLANPQLDTDHQAQSLHFNDAGYNGGLATAINVKIIPCSSCFTSPAVIFDDYLTQNGNVLASMDWLEFINAELTGSGQFQNAWENFILTGKGKSSIGPWYFFLIGDKFARNLDPFVQVSPSRFLQLPKHYNWVQPSTVVLPYLLNLYGFPPSN